MAHAPSGGIFPAGPRPETQINPRTGKPYPEDPWSYVPAAFPDLAALYEFLIQQFQKFQKTRPWQTHFAGPPIKVAHYALNHHFPLADGFPPYPDELNSVEQVNGAFRDLLRFVQKLLTTTDAGTDKATPKRQKRRPGRKRLSDAEASRRNRLIDDWRRAKETGISQKQFCRENRIAGIDLKRFIEWRSMCLRRQQK